MRILQKLKRYKKRLIAGFVAATILAAVPIIAEQFQSPMQAESVIAYDVNGVALPTFYKEDMNKVPVYCLNRNARQPNTSLNYTESGEIENKNVYNILAYGFPNHSYSNNNIFDYLVTQYALWMELKVNEHSDSTQANCDWNTINVTAVDSNIKIKWDPYTSDTFRQYGFNASWNNQSVTAKYFKACIYDLLNKARNTNNKQKAQINLSTNKLSTTIKDIGDKKYYLTDYVELSPGVGTLNQSQTGKLKLTVNEAVDGMYIYSESGELLPFNGTEWDRRLKTDAKIAIAILYDETQRQNYNLTFTLEGPVYYNAVYKFVSNNSGYQNIAHNSISQEGSVSASFTVNSKWQSGGVKITKKDVTNVDKPKSLANVSFQLQYKVPDSNPEEWVNWGKPKVTNSDGIVTWGGLPFYEYRALEVNAPEGYEFDPEKPITLGTLTTDGQVLEAIVENKKTEGSLQITKTNYNGDVPVKDAVFELYKDNKCTIKATYSNGTTVEAKTSGKDGILQWDHLPLGFYYVKETEAPDPYRVKTQPTVVNLKTAGVNKITITNNKKCGTLKVTKVDDQDTKLEGVKFGVYTNKECTNPLSFATTGPDGVATFRYLVIDTVYYLKEIEGLNGYTISDEISEVKITKDGQIIELTKVNKREIGNAQLKKVDPNGKALPAAQFKLLDENDKQVGEIQTTDDNGEVMWKDLPLGTYKFIEVKAPSGYVKDETPKIVVLDKVGETKTVTMKNVNVKGSIVIKKADKANTKMLAGAEFTLFNMDGSKVDLKIGENPTITNKAGYCSFANVPYGNYYVQETKAPEGYQISDKKYNISISGEDNNPIIELDITNEKYPFYLKVIKIDNENKERKLQGAEFVLLQDGKAVIPADTTETTTPETDTPSEGNVAVPEDKAETPSQDNEWGSKVFTTDENGEILFPADLDFGTYTLVEVKAPRGYIGMDKPFEFTIDESTKYTESTKDDKPIHVYDVTVGNTPGEGELEITKTDISTGELLPNASFVIYGEDSETVVEKGTTDETGIATFKLKIGKYYYQEFAAPDGYQVDNTKFPFEIKDNGEIVKCRMTNTKLPKTGILVRNFAIPGGICILVAGAFIALKVSSKRKQNN